jgi:hypothetical protein
MSKRDALRSAILGKKPTFRSEIVKHEGESYELRQPSNKSRRDLFKKVTDEAGRIDMMDFVLWAVIYNTYEPGTDNTVFEESDYDVLANLPAGGVVDKLGDVASKLLNVEEDSGKK